MLKEFVELLNSTEDKFVDVAELLKNPADKRRWLKMIEVFDNIQINNIPEGLEHVTKSFKFNKTEEITLLAYVKFLEVMVAKVAHVSDIKRDLNATEVMYG
jgi:hypothetical protein